MGKELQDVARKAEKHQPVARRAEKRLLVARRVGNVARKVGSVVRKLLRRPHVEKKHARRFPDVRAVRPASANRIVIVLHKCKKGTRKTVIN